MKQADRRGPEPAGRPQGIPGPRRRLGRGGAGRRSPCKLIAPDKSGDFHDALLDRAGQVNGDVALAVAEQTRPRHRRDQGQAMERRGQGDHHRSLRPRPRTRPDRHAVLCDGGRGGVGAVGYDALKAQDRRRRAPTAPTRRPADAGTLGRRDHPKARLAVAGLSLPRPTPYNGATLGDGARRRGVTEVVDSWRSPSSSSTDRTSTCSASASRRIYGGKTLAEIGEDCAAPASDFGLAVDFRQTNHEGVLVDWIQEAGDEADGIVINPAPTPTPRSRSTMRSARSASR